MTRPPAFLLSLSQLRQDPNLNPGGSGQRKILVTQVNSSSEVEAREICWTPPLHSDRCQVLKMANTEMAFFSQEAKQEKHFHKIATEIYLVLEGTMKMEVADISYELRVGDSLVVVPGSIHQVLSEREPFLCGVISVNCHGLADKYRV